jgi:hypothetical protein
MLMLGSSAGFCVEPSEPKGHRPVRPSWFSLYSFRCTDNPGWRGRNACEFFGRSTPGYLLSGLQPEEPGTGGTWRRG